LVEAPEVVFFTRAITHGFVGVLSHRLLECFKLVNWICDPSCGSFGIACFCHPLNTASGILAVCIGEATSHHRWLSPVGTRIAFWIVAAFPRLLLGILLAPFGDTKAEHMTTWRSESFSLIGAQQLESHAVTECLRLFPGRF
jgi:hypothetical protein